MTSPADLYILRPSLGGGGADRVTLTLLQELPRSEFRPTLVLTRAEGALLDEAPADVPVVSLDARDSRTAWLPLARLLRRRPPQVLMSTSGGTNLIAVLAARLAGSRARIVLSERNRVRGSATWKRRLATALKRRLYPRADLVTAVSEAVRDDLVREVGLPAERILVVYNPVVNASLETAASQPVAHDWFSEPTPTVLAVGRLVAQKDHATLITAFARARALRRARLVILGEGPLRPRLESLAGDLAVAADVSLPGFDGNPFRYMARCTVFASSSRYEGLPGALIQAMACGAPVVSTDCPGPAEVVTANEDGLLVRVGDAVALAEAIVDLLDDPAKRDRLARHAKASAAARFSVETCLPRYLRAIRGDVGAPAEAAP